jgi:hypothetical protein
MIEIPPEYSITWKFENGKWMQGQLYDIAQNETSTKRD